MSSVSKLYSYSDFGALCSFPHISSNMLHCTFSTQNVIATSALKSKQKNSSLSSVFYQHFEKYFWIITVPPRDEEKKFKYLLFCTIVSIFAAFCEMARSTFRLSLLHQWKSQLQTYTKQKQSLCKHPSISRQKMEKMCNKFFVCSHNVLETKLGKLIVSHQYLNF